MYREIHNLLRRGKATAEEIVSMIGSKNEELRSKKQYIKLLYSAKTNLQSSKILYEKGNYADSFNLFIQSVEKMGKVFEIFDTKKPLTEEMLKEKIGHEVIRIYERRAYEQAMKYKYVKKFLKENPKLENKLKNISFFKDMDTDKMSNSINNFLSYLQAIRKNRKDLIYISEKDLEEIIIFINKYYEGFSEAYSNYKNISEEEWKEFRESMKIWYELEEGELKKDEEEVFKNIIENMIKNNDILDKINELYVRISIISTSIICLSIVTLYHYDITRYPDTKDNDLWPGIYTKELPVIKKLPELFKIQDIIFYEFNELEKKIEK